MQISAVAMEIQETCSISGVLVMFFSRFSSLFLYLFPIGLYPALPSSGLQAWLTIQIAVITVKAILKMSNYATNGIKQQQNHQWVEGKFLRPKSLVE